MESVGVELLNFQTVTNPEDMLKRLVSIGKFYTKTFVQIALAFILPLSVTILARPVFTSPLLRPISIKGIGHYHHEWTQYFIFVFFYQMFVLVFSLLSTAAVVVTVNRIYNSRTVSFSITISAIPKVYKRLFVTSIFFFFFYFLCDIIFIRSVMIFYADDHPILFALYFIVYFLIFFPVRNYATAVWDLASGVSVLEPLSGLAALKESRKLLKGNTYLVMLYVTGYELIRILVQLIMDVVYTCLLSHGVLPKLIFGIVYIGILMALIFIDLVVQTIFYFVFKYIHEEEIPRYALFDHLTAYIGEHVPLKSICWNFNGSGFYRFDV